MALTPPPLTRSAPSAAAAAAAQARPSVAESMGFAASRQASGRNLMARTGSSARKPNANAGKK